MRTVMLTKWTSNLVLFTIITMVIIMVYWQQKLLGLEEQQNVFDLKLGEISQLSHIRALKKEGFVQNNQDNEESTHNGPAEDADNPVIIYNRIPKTGSTSLMGIAYELCTQNGFNVIHLNTTKNSHILSPEDQLRFAQNISSWYDRRPAIYHGHLGYIDFASLGVSLRPLYINVVRDPLDRLVSYYYFLRYGDNFRPEVIRRRKGNKESFDECVQRQGIDCDPVNLWMQIPFFCGHHSVCWEPGSSWALQQAKSNLAKSYFLVGTTESMDDFVALLEKSLPRFFKGASKLFTQEGKSHLRKTYGKKPPNKDTMKTIHKSKVWQMEQDFYMFAKKNFNAIKKRAVPLNGSAIAQQFRFEKIRPK